ncbi:hypothetical protein COZ73_01970 [Candidatus Falkowbacteria bacterium CG_4_8_14_3_um_filter_36_11]|nr:MAG: hypothetical protein COZ73_01970 [Candidatus Falkowbacteria bacterium CG_4_8_14_3_um_filter_36_11]
MNVTLQAKAEKLFKEALEIGCSSAGEERAKEIGQKLFLFGQDIEKLSPGKSGEILQKVLDEVMSQRADSSMCWEKFNQKKGGQSFRVSPKEAEGIK